MSVVVVAGDGSTTTALALAATWPTPRRAVVIEADQRGGSLAAWLELPRRPGLAEVVSRATTPTDADLDAAIQLARSGVEVVVAPVAAREARAALAAAGPTLAAWGVGEQRVVILDAGREADVLHHVAADIVVVAHRQEPASIPAAAVRLERLRDTCAELAARSPLVIAAIRGSRPYGRDELADFLAVDVAVLADDPFAAAVLAGRPASARRLAVSPLLRTASALATRLDRALDEVIEAVDA